MTTSHFIYSTTFLGVVRVNLTENLLHHGLVDKLHVSVKTFFLPVFVHNFVFDGFGGERLGFAPGFFLAPP